MSVGDLAVHIIAVAAYVVLFVLAVRIANAGGKDERERNEKLRAEKLKNQAQ